MPAASPGIVSLGAAVAALFFAVHPLRVESVAWITERRDLTSGLFFLLDDPRVPESPRAAPRGDDRAGAGPRWAPAALALASKSIVMGLPLVLLILDIYPLGRLGPRVRDWWSRQARRVWLEKIPFALLAVAAAATAYLVQRSTGYSDPDRTRPAGSAWSRTTCGSTSGRRRYRSTWAPIYELPTRVNPLELPYLLSAAGALAITATVWLLRRRWPAGLAIWAFYLVMLAPVAGFVHTGNHLGADRNTYVSGMGFALLVGGAAAALVLAWRRGTLRPPITALALGVMAIWLGGLALSARAQSSVWHDSETLWRYAIAVDPGCAICHHNLGIILGRRGDRTEAQALLERAIALRPDRSEFQGNYGVLLHPDGPAPGRPGQAPLPPRAESPGRQHARQPGDRPHRGWPPRGRGRRARARAACQAGLGARADLPRPGPPRRRPRGARAGRLRAGARDQRRWTRSPTSGWRARTSRAAIAPRRASRSPSSSVSIRQLARMLEQESR